MITYGLGTLALLTMGLGNARIVIVSVLYHPPPVVRNVEFVNLPAEVTFEEDKK